jgi:pimeloyl-ACP methyl ester carboxylesterase
MVDTSRDPSDTRRDDLTSRTTFSRDGLVFDVRESGPPEGTPVVLLHGLQESSANRRTHRQATLAPQAARSQYLSQAGEHREADGGVAAALGQGPS